ncbi:DUF2189 domain-containing protein [Parvibaculum sedimenti]|uniref:DUF2189 domain-containing protein n=1 Tax=Parvibaculum sedimenti TaxID=2608632 RepID=A0A6N6VLH3_9HYPH|nr:DUF2189 domain-containing protein [Parvibaculum sedimenti]KAB7742286.1 DUF2189 domain-containing protein [Parvibaculum sedimenti]
MSIDNAEAPQRAPSIEIRTVTVNNILEALAAGMRDLRAGFSHSIAFGAFIATGGWILVLLLIKAHLPYLVYPLAMAFALIAPFIATGLYEISRRLQVGEAVRWSGIAASIRAASGRDMGWMALVTSFTFVIWMDIAAILTFGFLGLSATSFTAFVSMVFSTSEGFAFLIVGNTVGAAIALAVFSLTVISFPMLFDRDVDFVTAMITSVRTVLANPRAMLTWFAIIGFLSALSFLSLFVGLVFFFPLLGHASWHIYRRAVAPAVRLPSA